MSKNIVYCCAFVCFRSSSPLSWCFIAYMTDAPPQDSAMTHSWFLSALNCVRLKIELKAAGVCVWMCEPWLCACTPGVRLVSLTRWWAAGRCRPPQHTPSPLLPAKHSSPANERDLGTWALHCATVCPPPSGSTRGFPFNGWSIMRALFLNHVYTWN